MQLREAEAVGVLDDHHAGVRYVHPHLDDGGRNHDLRLAPHEALHLEVLVGGLHFAMHDTDLVLLDGEFPAQHLITLHQVFQVHLLALLDERKHDVNLAALRNLLLHEPENPHPVVLRAVRGGDWLAARRQLVYHRHVEVAVERHGEGAGNGRGRHHEHVRGQWLAFFPKGSPLRHAESVLLVGDGEAEVLELHPVLDEGVGADEDLDFAASQFGEYLLPLLALDAPGEVIHPDAQPFHQLADANEVLLRKDFGGRHHAGLVTVVERQQHGEQRHDGLSAAHVALHEAVHLDASTEVGPDFLDDPLLCAREFERQFFLVKTVEMLAHFFKNITFDGRLAAMFALQQAHLQKEKLLEF